MAHIEREPGQEMSGAVRGEVDADRADGKTLIGAAHHVHGDGVGVGGERLAAEDLAPCLELAPGRAVGMEGIVSAGAHRIDGGTPRQLLDVRGGGGVHSGAAQ
jgi:hypothetical protein